MGETLGIAHNVFEKMERERDRKERLKKVEDWNKEKGKKRARIKEMQNRVKDAEQKKATEQVAVASNGSSVDPMLPPGYSNEDPMDSLGGSQEELGSSIDGSPPPRAGASAVTLSRMESATEVRSNQTTDLEPPEMKREKKISVTVAPPSTTSVRTAESRATASAEEKTPKCGKCSIQ
jgi:hypothetical protein